MKKMSLKEGRITKQRLLDKLKLLQEKRKRIAKIKILPGEYIRDFIDGTADALTEQIDACIENIVAAGDAVRRGEIGTAEGSGGADIASIKERAALLLAEAELCKEMGTQLPKSRETVSPGASNAQLISVVTYDINSYERRTERLQNEVDALSMRIAQLEIDTMVEI